MSTWLVLLGIGCHAFSGVPGLFMGRKSEGGTKASVLFALLGSVLGITGALAALLRPAAPTWAVSIDGLSVLFLLPIFVIPALCSLYGWGYWKQAEHPLNGQKLRLFYGLVTAALAWVTIAANAILFLVAWEIMALSAFFLITTEDEHLAVRETGWVYLVSTHMATLCLFVLFALMRNATGSFELVPLPDSVASGTVTAIFVLAVIGFGIKAGLMPLHIWLPGAHALAPSHVSALLSGVLIKIGIYGLVRVVSLLPHPPLWWGVTLLAAGTLSGVLGVAFALGQHDLKRLLAYHSIENIGIIFMGLGLALVGRTLGRMDCMVLGLAGALLHVWNHGLFKSLLFLSAGAVIHATGTRELDRLGGLAKAMPRTAFCFALGAAAICGLPPLNGFVSELLIYLGLFRSLGGESGAAWAGAAFAAPALALIGALAVACFVKAFGTVFLGQARSDHTLGAHEPPPFMTVPMMVLVGCCFLIGLAPFLVVPALERAVSVWAAGSAPAAGLAALVPLRWISVFALALVGGIGATYLLLSTRTRLNGATCAGTWDCGYAVPGPRMQYTSSSFAQWPVGFFSWVLRPGVHLPSRQPLFSGETRFSSHVPDLILDRLMRPSYRLGARVTSSFRFLQAGNIHAYLFYIVVILIGLLLWR
jgi:hydrogenase-4 component B